MVAIALAVTAVAGTAYAINQQEKAASAARAASSRQVKQQEVQASQSRKRAFREFQSKRAMARAQAQALGAGGGSGAMGGQAAFASLFGSELGYSSQMTGLSREITQFGAVQQTALANAQTGSAVSGLAMSALPYAPQIKSAIL